MLGATYQPTYIKPSIMISIHAPMLGATLGSIRGGEDVVNFNPRPYVRSDCIPIKMPEEDINFNPRPYVRSDATFNTVVAYALYFNPRPYVRSDYIYIYCHTYYSKFQSTPLC